MHFVLNEIGIPVPITCPYVFSGYGESRTHRLLILSQQGIPIPFTYPYFFISSCQNITHSAKTVSLVPMGGFELPCPLQAPDS